MRRTRGERRDTTKRKVENLARKLRQSRGPWLSVTEAYRAALTRGRYSKWTWDKETYEK